MGDVSDVNQDILFKIQQEDVCTMILTADSGEPLIYGIEYAEIADQVTGSTPQDYVTEMIQDV